MTLAGGAGRDATAGVTTVATTEVPATANVAGAAVDIVESSFAEAAVDIVESSLQKQL